MWILDEGMAAFIVDVAKEAQLQAWLQSDSPWTPSPSATFPATTCPASKQSQPVCCCQNCTPNWKLRATLIPPSLDSLCLKSMPQPSWTLATNRRPHSICSFSLTFNLRNSNCLKEELPPRSAYERAQF